VVRRPEVGHRQSRRPIWFYGDVGRKLGGHDTDVGRVEFWEHFFSGTFTASDGSDAASGTVFGSSSAANVNWTMRGTWMTCSFTFAGDGTLSNGSNAGSVLTAIPRSLDFERSTRGNRLAPDVFAKPCDRQHGGFVEGVGLHFDSMANPGRAEEAHRARSHAHRSQA
jgi:hypothetical protein